MRLKKLTAEALQAGPEKKICCYERSEQHLTELCEKYNVLDRLCLIADENKRRQGACALFGRTVPVKAPDVLPQMDWTAHLLVITSDYYWEAYEQLEKMLDTALEEIYYFANQEAEYEEAYRDFYRDKPLENLMVFRSGPHASAYVPGMDFDGNARALFDYMLERGWNSGYKLVWLVKNPADFSRYDDIPNVEFVSFDWSVSEDKQERDRYYHPLCTAKFLFFTDAYGFARRCRRDQVRVQLWHGCGFKTRVNFVRCEKRYEYTTVVSELYGKIHQDIYGLRADQILVTGYAKEDWLFQPPRPGFKDRLGIPDAKKYIYWLPTFRTAGGQLAQLNEKPPGSETGLPVVDTWEQMDQLNRLLKREEMVLVIKLHPFQDRSAVGRVRASNIILLDNGQLFREDIPINQLLGTADALVSDYSSAAVDFLLLDRPIAFLLPDVEEYGANRGFVFEPIRDWLPGVEVDSFAGFLAFIQEIAAGTDSSGNKRGELRKQMHAFQDNQSCSRILRALGIEEGEKRDGF